MNRRTLFFLAAVLTVVAINHCYGMEFWADQQKDPVGQHIIFLNGTTTAGKSSIAAALKQILEQTQSLPVEVLASDTFFAPKVLWLLAKNRFNPLNIFVANLDLITPSEIEEINKESQAELCMEARAAYEQGKIIIIDAPAYRPDQIGFFKQTLADLKVIWSLVYCPVSTLVERVINRNAGGISEERSILQALDQFNYLYSGSTIYTIDTLLQENLKSVCRKAQVQHSIMQDKIPGFLKGIQNAICPFDLNTIQRSMVKNFKFDRNTEANIGPAIKYDCIVNTGLYSPATCAQVIIDDIQKKQFGDRQ